MDFKALVYYNITFEEFDYFEDPKFPKDVNVTEFFDNIFYQINKDFHLVVEIEKEPYVYENIYLKEGHNTDLEENIVLKRVLTFWTGFCYKITFDVGTFQKNPYFYLTFDNKTISKEELPHAILYITSEENADGIINLSWHNAAELKLTLKHYWQIVQLRAHQYKYFKSTSKCTSDISNQCKAEIIFDLEYANFR